MPNKPRNSRKPIFEHVKKFQFLKTHPLPMRLLGHNGSKYNLHEMLGLKFPSREVFSKDWEIGDLCDPVLDALGNALFFDAGSPLFLHGPAEAWIESYLHTHGFPTSAEERKVGARLRAAPRARPVQPFGDLACVQIEATQPGSGTIALQVRVIANTAPVQEVLASMIRCRLDLHFSFASLTEGCRQFWRESHPVPGSRASFRMSHDDPWHPSWELRTADTQFGTVEFDPRFATLQGLAPFDLLTMELRVLLRDLNDVELDADDAASVVLVNADGTEIPISGLSELQRRMMSFIRTKSARFRMERDGYCLLALHSLLLMEDKTWTDQAK